MSDDINFSAEVVGLDALISKFDDLPEDIMAQLGKDCRFIEVLLKERIRAYIHSKTGNLANSIQTQLDVYPDSIEIYASSEGVRYFDIQNEGGTTPPHQEMAKGAPGKSAMAWLETLPNKPNVKGSTNFFYSVKHPGATITAKNFMLKGLQDTREEFITVCQDAVATAMIRDLR